MSVSSERALALAEASLVDLMPTHLSATRSPMSDGRIMSPLMPSTSAQWARRAVHSPTREAGPVRHRNALDDRVVGCVGLARGRS
jgi:hypothetical protein